MCTLLGERCVHWVEAAGSSLHHLNKGLLVFTRGKKGKAAPTLFLCLHQEKGADGDESAPNKQARSVSDRQEKLLVFAVALHLCCMMVTSQAVELAAVALVL